MTNFQASGDECGERRWQPHILMGITSAQTCLILRGRLNAFREAGFRISLLSAPGELLECTAGNEGAKACPIPMQRGISPISDCVSLFRIWRLLREIKPDLVEFSTPKAGLLGNIAALLCKIPVRVYLLRGLRLETECGVKRRLLLIAERIAAWSAHVVICNSRSLRKRALEFRIAPGRKLEVLGEGSSSGVDPARFSPGQSSIHRALAIPVGAFVIGFAGRLTVDKGLPELLEAFEIVLQQRPNSYLLLVGWFDASDDALDIKTRARIESHPRIVCTGLVPDTSAYYRAMDLLVLPSRREGFPNVILEAAATGIPVVATHCTGSRDAVISEVTGLLVPPGYPDAIAEAVLRLLGDPELRRRMANAARAWVVENYDHRQVLGATVTFYESLLRRAVGPREEANEPQNEAAIELPVSP